MKALRYARGLPFDSRFEIVTNSTETVALLLLLNSTSQRLVSVSKTLTGKETEANKGIRGI